MCIRDRVDQYLENATEVDVDIIRDGKGEIFVAGLMEHIEEAGIHSGDSACSLPPFSISKEIQNTIIEWVSKIAAEIKVVGLMNTQLAIKNNEVYVLEVNPRASRTVPFVAKARSIPIAKIAAKVMTGDLLKDILKELNIRDLKTFNVKESVFPFNKFDGVDLVLGPEMKSTGEVMGIDSTFLSAFAKSQIACSTILPSSGQVFISIDAAASELYNNSCYTLKGENKKLDSDQLIKFWENICNTFPVISIEDPFDENDWPGFKELTNLIGNNCLLYTSPSPRDATLSRMPSSA